MDTTERLNKQDCGNWEKAKADLELGFLTANLRFVFILAHFLLKSQLRK